jgi:hypothetical protein
MAGENHRELSSYLLQVWAHWKAVVTSGAVAALYACLKLASTDPRHFWNKDVAGWVFGLVIVSALFFAQYLAWRDERRLRDHLDGILSERDPVKRALNELSPDALELLEAVAQDPRGSAWRISAQIAIIKVGNRVFASDGDPRTEARWLGALRDLGNVGALELEGDSRYQITDIGYKITERHRPAK